MRAPFFLLSLVTALSLSTFAAADYSVECEGTDDDTGEYVYGTCENGSFEGEDSDTGGSVSGDCEFGGDLDAYNDDTGEHVSGECEGE